MKLWDRLVLTSLHAETMRLSTSPLAQWVTPAGYAVFALGPYEGCLGGAISCLKYRDQPALAGPLGRLLARKLDLDAALSLVPVPLHPVRLAERGYNQTALLARAISKERGWPVHFSLLERLRHTRAQAQLTGNERRSNLAEVFSCPTGPARFMAEREAVLVDDVVTTGTTVDSCAEALRASGIEVQAIIALALALPNAREHS